MLRSLVLSTTVAAGVGPAQLSAVVQLAVPVMIEAAAPAEGGAGPCSELSVKLLTHLASGPAAGAFREAVASLGPASKQRLQAALLGARAGAEAAPAGGVPAPEPAAEAARPAIQLKTFAFAAPKKFQRE